MLRILGSESKLCDGLSRRDLLQIGGLGTLGLNVADWFGLRETQAASSGQPSSFGKAKACILVFLTGSPPQHETFDPKPLAPAALQGEPAMHEPVAPELDVPELKTSSPEAPFVPAFAVRMLRAPLVDVAPSPVLTCRCPPVTTAPLPDTSSSAPP